MPPEHPNTKLTAEKRDEYIEHLRNGSLKMEAARLIGVSYRTIQRRREDDDDFEERIKFAMMEALEGIEKILYEMALEHDLGAIDRWLKAHGRSTYNDKHIVQIDATQSAIDMTANVALAKVADLQKTLADRSARMLDADFIEAPSKELPPTEDLSPCDDCDPQEFEI